MIFKGTIRKIEDKGGLVTVEVVLKRNYPPLVPKPAQYQSKESLERAQNFYEREMVEYREYQSALRELGIREVELRTVKSSKRNRKINKEG